MTDTIDAILERVERLDAKATPGPWESGCVVHCEEEGRDCWHTFTHQSDVFPPLGECGPVAIASGEDGDNAFLIAAYRSDAPALAAEVRRLRSAMSELQEAYKLAVKTRGMATNGLVVTTTATSAPTMVPQALPQALAKLYKAVGKVVT